MPKCSDISDNPSMAQYMLEQGDEEHIRYILAELPRHYFEKLTGIQVLLEGGTKKSQFERFVRRSEQCEHVHRDDSSSVRKKADACAGAVSAEDAPHASNSSVSTVAFSTSLPSNAVTVHWWHNHGNEAVSALEGSDVRVTKSGTIGSLARGQGTREALRAARTEKPDVIAMYMPKLDEHIEGMGQDIFKAIARLVLGQVLSGRQYVLCAPPYSATWQRSELQPLIAQMYDTRMRWGALGEAEQSCNHQIRVLSTMQLPLLWRDETPEGELARDIPGCIEPPHLAWPKVLKYIIDMPAFGCIFLDLLSPPLARCQPPPPL
ncbi:hypothetical protein N9L19_00020 [bacterium]|nr:hypothetical protein [bacterium]